MCPTPSGTEIGYETDRSRGHWCWFRRADEMLESSSAKPVVVNIRNQRTKHSTRIQITEYPCLQDISPPDLIAPLILTNQDTEQIVNITTSEDWHDHCICPRLQIEIFFLQAAMQQIQR